MSLLAIAYSEQFLTLLIGQVVIIIGGISKVTYDWLASRKARGIEEDKRKNELQGREQDRLDREQDRKDREQLATLTLSQLASVQDKGDARLKTLVKEVQEVKQVAIAGIKASKAAIDVANGHNEKIASAVEISKQVLTRLDTPQLVEVVNTDEHPIPTHITNES